MITKEMIRKHLFNTGATHSDDFVDALYEFIYVIVGLKWLTVEDARKAVSIKMDEITTELFFHPDKTREILQKNYGVFLKESA